MTKKSSRRKSRTGRRIYSDELKAEAVQMLLDGHSATSVASNLGLSGANLLYRWKAKLLQQSGPAAATLENRVRQLEDNLRRVERERDILKKVAPRKAWEEGILSFGWMKLLIGTQWGLMPIRQSVTGSRKRVLRGAWGNRHYEA